MFFLKIASHLKKKKKKKFRGFAWMLCIFHLSTYYIAVLIVHLPIPLGVNSRALLTEDLSSALLTHQSNTCHVQQQLYPNLRQEHRCKGCRSSDSGQQMTVLCPLDKSIVHFRFIKGRTRQNAHSVITVTNIL